MQNGQNDILIEKTDNLEDKINQNEIKSLKPVQVESSETIEDRVEEINTQEKEKIFVGGSNGEDGEFPMTFFLNRIKFFISYEKLSLYELLSTKIVINYILFSNKKY